MNQPTQRLFGLQVLENLLTNKPQLITSLWLDNQRHDQRLQALQALAEAADIPVQPGSSQSLDDLAQGGMHQGAVADMVPDNLFVEQDLTTQLTRLSDAALLLLLDGVQDPHNLGACLRSAEAAGVGLVMIPKDRAADITPVVRRTACGAAEMVPVVRVTNVARVIELCQQQGFWTIGTTDSAPRSIYPQPGEKPPPGKLLLVMGGEQKGIRQLTAKRCDELRSLPMRGKISSLNVSVATGICLFELRRQMSG